MAKVLLAWELGSGAGHCVKLAPLADALVGRGHEVSVAARDLVTARQVFGSLNVSYFQSPHLSGRPPNPVAQVRSLADILHNSGFGDAASLEVLCAAWRSLFSAINPDLVICDHAPMGLLACRWQSIRRVIVGTGFTVPPVISPLPDLRYWLASGTPFNELKQVEEPILGRINELLATDGVEQFGCLADLYSGADETFVLTFQELDHYPRRNGVHYWGTWSAEGGCTPEWQSGGPKLFAYLKPPGPNWRLAEFLGFLRELRLPTVAYVGGADPRWLLKFQSPQLRFACRAVEIQHVARNCDFAILNGNAGSVTALLLAGIPQLNLPLYLEQMIMSRRVAELGAGLYANPARPEQIAARLMTLMQNDRYRQTAQSFSSHYAEFNPQKTIEQIAHRIEGILAT